MSTVPETGHAENFSLKDFFDSAGTNLLERVRPFSDYYRASRENGDTLYCREISGPAGARVRVREPRTSLEREMLMFGSNNYLGLANHPEVRAKVKEAVDRFGIGMGGPPLLNGMSSLHRELEMRLAALKGAEDCLLFASGFQANLGWVNGLLRDNDVLIYDELNHASLYDAIRLASRSAKIHAYRFDHNSVAHLEKLLGVVTRRAVPRRQVFVAVEGVYSMDGDLAPLPAIREVCDRYSAALIVDDAHGTAVMGPTGGGTAEHFGLKGRVDINMGTFSKSFGTTGGFVAASRDVVTYLRFFARSYMFSAHLPPPVVAAVLAGLDVVEREPALLAALHENARYLEEGLRALGFRVRREAAILPIPVPVSIDIRRLATRFHEEGIFLNSVEYPAVPRDAQRLRVSVMAIHSKADLDRALEVFEKLCKEFGWQ